MGIINRENHLRNRRLIGSQNTLKIAMRDVCRPVLKFPPPHPPPVPAHSHNNLELINVALASFFYIKKCDEILTNSKPSQSLIESITF
jgi:hypothetical protein